MSAALYDGGQETIYDAVFRELTEQTIKELQHEKTFEKSTLWIKCKAILQEQGVMVKTTLIFEGYLVFHQPHDWTNSELLYSSYISITS